MNKINVLTKCLWKNLNLLLMRTSGCKPSGVVRNMSKAAIFNFHSHMSVCRLPAHSSSKTHLSTRRSDRLRNKFYKMFQQCFILKLCSQIDTSWLNKMLVTTSHFQSNSRTENTRLMWLERTLSSRLLRGQIVIKVSANSNILGTVVHFWGNYNINMQNGTQNHPKIQKSHFPRCNKIWIGWNVLIHGLLTSTLWNKLIKKL